MNNLKAKTNESDFGTIVTGIAGCDVIRTANSELILLAPAFHPLTISELEGVVKGMKQIRKRFQ